MKRIWFAIMAVCAFATTAWAQVDPRPDVLGVYFDEQATVIHTHCAPFQVLNMYVVLTRPSVAAITGWEAGIELTGPSVVVAPVLPNGGVNHLEPPMYRITYDAPLPCSPTTVVMTLPVVLLNYERQCIGMFAVVDPTIPGDLPVLFLEAGGHMQASVHLMATGNTVAQINGDDEPIIGGNYVCAYVVHDEYTSWGALKSMYK